MSTLKVDTITDEAGTGAPTLSQGLNVNGGTIKLDGNYPVGTNNVALGNNALDDVSLTGANNVAVGTNSLTANTSGADNTSVGQGSLAKNTGGTSGVGIGTGSLNDNTTGNNNVAVGRSALESNTTASNNTAVGYRSQYTNSTGTNNVSVGKQSLNDNTTGSSNTAIGVEALIQNTTASNNTAVGYQAAYSNTTGSAVTAMGYYTLNQNTTGVHNNAYGYRAMRFNTTGGYNTALGGDALYSNTTASYNTAVGYQAGYNSVNADSTFIGTYAGYAASYAGTGRNTFIGFNSGGAVTSGRYNTILGSYNGNQGGLDIRTSSNNIVLSDGDGNPRVVVNSSGATSIGTTTSSGQLTVKATADRAAGSFIVNANGDAAISIKNSSSTTVGTIVANASSTAYNTSSDYRLKENVVYDWDATTRLKQLKPARFNFIADADTTVDGFLAHEAQAVVPECATGTHNEVDDDGNAVMQGIDQSKLVPLLVKTIQELEARITALENA